MDCTEVSKRIAFIKSELDDIAAHGDELPPCLRSGLENARAHIDLLSIELGQDVDL